MAQRDVQARIRKRIRDRLDDLRMTARELAEACHHKDAWISGILNEHQGLSWDDFDAVAAKLKLSPSELVRYDDSEMRELTPSEMKLLRHYQNWPDAIKHRWLDVLDFFAATSPDRDTAVLLTLLRDTPRSLRAPTMRWLERLLLEGTPPTLAIGDGGPVTAATKSGRGTTHRARSSETTRESQSPDAGPRDRRKSRGR